MRIRFVGYAGDCIITAALELGDGRLTDLLNRTPRVRLLDGSVEALDDGRVVPAGEVSLELGELFAARALDGEGPSERRIQTVRHRLVAWAGPYVVEGLFHARPGASPTVAFGRRSGMIPFTDAVVTYMCGGQVRREEVPVLLVNRDLVNQVQRAWSP